jgi:hypothetical protein
VGALSGFFFNDFARGRTAHLLVRVEQDSHSLPWLELQGLNCFKGVQSDGNPGLHVQNARPVCQAILYSERPLHDGPRRPDGIHVTEYQGLALTLPKVGYQVITHRRLGHRADDGTKPLQSVPDVRSHGISACLIGAEGLKFHKATQSPQDLISPSVGVVEEFWHDIVPLPIGGV